MMKNAPLRLALAPLALAAALASFGCAANQNLTSTPRSAIEQALLTQAAEQTLSELDAVDAKGKKFFLVQPEKLEPADKQFLLDSLRLRLLSQGLEEADKQEDADLVVTPRVAHAGTDNSVFLLGIPSIPIPVGGATVSTPELALFKRRVQEGHNRMGAFGVKRETGDLAFDLLLQANKRYYTQWTVLIFFHWRTTDLIEPF